MLEIPTRYNKETFKIAIQQPNKFYEEIIRILFSSAQPLFKLYFEQSYNSAKETNPMDEDWDNLLILDACRYDKLREANPTENELDYRILQSSDSPGFIDEYFSGGTFHDTIYVTANPFVTRIEHDVFFDVVTPYGDTDNGLERQVIVDDVGGKWAPEVLYKLALEAHSNHPNKRLIVHFMQPHAPYFGEKARELRAFVKDNYDVRFWAWNDSLERIDGKEEDCLAHLLPAASRGYISVDQLNDIYLENLEIVLGYALDLSENIGGMSVITSDHGEMLGESYYFKRAIFGHRGNIFDKTLRKVPWLTLDNGERREIVEGPSVNTQTDLSLDQQLRALGYAE